MLIEAIDATPERLLALAASDPRDFPLLFNSAASGPLSEWSMLAALPTAWLRLRGGRLECHGVQPAGGFLDTLDRAWRAERQAPAEPATDPAVPPFRGGWAVLLGYEVAGEIEPGLRLPPPGASATEALALRIPAVLAWDHRRRQGWLVAEDGTGPRLGDLRRRLAGCLSGPHGAPPLRVGLPGITLALGPTLAGIKHLNRLENVLAQREAGLHDCDEVVMCGSRGEPVCGSMSNLIVCTEEGMLTPSVESAGVRGVMRSLALDAAAACALPLVVATLTPAQLFGARALYCSNVRWGLRRAGTLDGRPLGDDARIARLMDWIDAQP